jgi:Peptidase family C25
VKVVDIQHVFDEFSYGIETPQAVKDFVAYAYTSWQRPAPQHVLLVGDATYDPKGNWSWYLGDPTATYLPTYLAFTPHMGETATDEWFTRVSGDDAVPDLYLGRIPAATSAQAAVMVNKIIAYETSPNTKTWEKNVVLISDNAVEDYESVFETVNEDAAALLPPSMASPFKGYLADYLSVDDLTGDMKTWINAGALLVNYSGHGSTQILAHERVFDTGDVADLSNGDKLPFFISMTCLAGYFTYPESWSFPSLAESLLRPEGKGAVTAFMPTGMTVPEGQHVLDRALFDAVFTQDIRTLGPAISAAKQTLLANGAEYAELSETFLLFGDPAMGLRVPLPRRVSGVAAEGTKNGVSLSWQAALDCNGNAVSSYNVYRATSFGGTYVQVNSSPVTGLSFADTGLAGGGTCSYVVSAVDGDGLEGARSAAIGVTAGSETIHAGSSSGGGGGSGCFVATAADRLLDGKRAARLAAVTLAASVLVLLVAFSRRRCLARRPGGQSSLPEDRAGTDGR